MKIKAILLSVVAATFLSGCASVAMAPAEKDQALKQFDIPPKDKAGLYIYRNTFVGQALKKTVSVNGVAIGETANKVYFYRQIPPGKHTISTESEFSDNSISFIANPGTNYFVEQYIKMGVFVGGAGLRMVEENVGKRAVNQCKLAL